MTLTVGRLMTVVYRVLCTCLRKNTRFFIYYAIVQYLKSYVCYVCTQYNGRVYVKRFYNHIFTSLLVHNITVNVIIVCDRKKLPTHIFFLIKKVF